MPAARLLLLLLFAALLPLAATARKAPDGTVEQPFRVLLIPADGGTADGTKADFQPLFDAISKTSGFHFDIRTGQSYAAVIEGICTGLADIAWFGPGSFIKARDRGCAELLAVEERGGSSSYYSGIFVSASSAIRTPQDLAGKSLALGSTHSTSSFTYPLFMLSQAGIDPLKDFSAIRVTGSHSNSLLALANGQVDAAGASFISFERAVNQGSLDASDFRLLMKSDPIPNPPLAIRSDLPASVKAAISNAIATVHEAPGVNPAAIRGYGGKQVDRYDVAADESMFDKVNAANRLIGEDYQAAILRKTGTAGQ